MSDTNTDTDTSAIDDKKSSTSSKSYATKMITFLKSVAMIILHVFIYFLLGSLVLYTCKISQANILPTDDNCYPYTDDKPNIQEIQANIFTTYNFFKNEQSSMKIKFPYDKYNSSHTLLDLIRNYRDSQKSFFLINYFLSIFEELIRFNYSMINFIFNMLNQAPETLVVLGGPVILALVATFLMFIEHIYFIYLWFAKMSWFFKHNSASDSGEEKAQWEDISMFSPVGYMIAIILVFVFAFLIMAVLPLSPLIIMILMGISVVSLGFYKCQLNGANSSFVTVLRDVFKYYKLTIMTTFSVFIVLTAFSKLGTTSGVFCIITLACIYFGIIAIRMFNTVKETHLSPLTSYDQATKKCAPKQKGLSLFGGQKGGNITKELKKLSKKLNG